MGSEQKRDAPGKEIEENMTAGKGIGKEHEKDGKYLRFSSLR
jgi:hypothetical protein